MMRKYIGAMAITGLLLASTVASAGIIEHGSYFTDTTNGLDWLNNTPLAGQSYNSVLAGYGGYTISGWRFATSGELNALVSTYIGPFTATSYPWTTSIFSASAYNAAYKLVEFLGINVSFGDPPDPRATKSIVSSSLTGIGTQGVFDDGGGGSNVGVFGLSAYVFSDSPNAPLAQVQIFPDSNAPDDFHGLNVSAILVRTSVTEVPEPQTLALTLVGVAGLTLSLRRRKSQ